MSKYFLGDFYFLSKLTKEELDCFYKMVKPRNFKKGEYLFQENTQGKSLFLIRSGRVCVEKTSTVIQDELYGTIDPFEDVVIKHFEAGRVIGEANYLDKINRTKSVRATEDCEVWEVDYEDIDALKESSPALYHKIVEGFGRSLSRRLRNSNDLISEGVSNQLLHMKKILFVSNFFTKSLSIMLGYIFFLNFLELFRGYMPKATTFFSVLMIAIIGWLLFSVKERPSLSMYGLTRKNWARSLKEGLLATVVMLVVATGLKYVFTLVEGSPLYGRPIFDIVTFSGWKQTLIVYFLYIVFSPVQELLTRGFLQAPLQELIQGKYRIFQAIILSNLVFGVLHLHLNPIFFILVFVPGVVWGWLFSRTRNILGVSISHAIVGFYFFNIIGFKYLIVG